MPNPQNKTAKLEKFLVVLGTTLSIITKLACDLYKEPHLDFAYELSKESKGICAYAIKCGCFSGVRYLNIKICTSHGPVAEKHIKLT